MRHQLGNGFFQFYGQDTASKSFPYDFSVDPDLDPDAEKLPPAENFFWYNKIGNTAFIGFSGAHSYASMSTLIDEACAWAAETNPSLVVL